MTGLKDTKHLVGIKSGLETYKISFERIQHLPGTIQEQSWDDIRWFRGYKLRLMLQDRLCKICGWPTSGKVGELDRKAMGTEWDSKSYLEEIRHQHGQHHSLLQYRLRFMQACYLGPCDIRVTLQNVPLNRLDEMCLIASRVEHPLFTILLPRHLHLVLLFGLQLFDGGAQPLGSYYFGPVLPWPWQSVHGTRFATIADTIAGAPGQATKPTPVGQSHTIYIFTGHDPFIWGGEYHIHALIHTVFHWPGPNSIAACGVTCKPSSTVRMVTW